jgi:predicted GIY-YIG superfamily endonuclease
VYDVGRRVFCVYLLAAGGGIAYASSSGRVEERLRRRSRGYSSAAARGLRPGAAYVLACTRSRSLAPAREAWLHKAYQPPYAAKTPAKAEETSPPATRVVRPTGRGLRAGPPHPPAARQIPPPSPAAGGQAHGQDVGRGERRRPQLARSQSPSEGSI